MRHEVPTDAGNPEPFDKGGLVGTIPEECSPGRCHVSPSRVSLVLDGTWTGGAEEGFQGLTPRDRETVFMFPLARCEFVMRGGYGEHNPGESQATSR